MIINTIIKQRTICLIQVFVSVKITKYALGPTFNLMRKSTLLTNYLNTWNNVKVAIFGRLQFLKNPQFSEFFWFVLLNLSFLLYLLIVDNLKVVLFDQSSNGLSCDVCEECVKEWMKYKLYINSPWGYNMKILWKHLAVNDGMLSEIT